ncbi:MAG: radical SAM protein [Deltaproteobacteria bacterium]|nr:radical SAM protein [Deltaproteobacteria bacterium]MBT4526409.1 radical SAM protein [Deltaproteobacteria bacterium]
MKNIINMYFAPFKSCNLNCKYCYVPKLYKNVAKPDSKTILNRLELLISKIETDGFQIGAFCLHGSEPALMAPDTLVKISTCLKSHWTRLRCSNRSIAIQSNGTRFTYKYLGELKNRLSRLSDVKLGFSIDPPKVIHDQFRDNSFNLVEQNYLHALDIGFPVSVLSVVTDTVMEHLEGFKGWMKEQLDRKAQTGNPYKVKIKLASAPKMFSLAHIPAFTDFLIENNLQSLLQILTPGYCLQAGNECEWYEFDIDGNCYSCNKNFNQESVFANWMQEPIVEIVAKRKQLFVDDPMHAECCLCEYEMICNSGCPLDRIKSGDLSGKAHECEMIKKILNQKEKQGIHFIDFYNQNI